jgi:peptidyl-dipeptidase Dcp
MRAMRRLYSALAIALLAFAACAPQPSIVPAPPKPAPPPAATPSVATYTPPPAPRKNPLLEPSPLPFHMPQFDKIRDTDFEPAFKAGMKKQLEEVARIAHNPAPATFENTIVAMERTGRLLTRVSKTFFNLNASNTDDAMNEIETDMAPKLSAHQDSILLDPALFARVDAVYQEREKLHLDPESAQLLSRYEDMFVRAGARLSPGDKARLKKINEQLSSLATKFRQDVLKATKDGAVVVDDVKELDGLSPEQIGAAAQAAKARGLEGKWVITLQNTTIQPPLEQMKNRALRKRVYEASIGRCQAGDTDNTAIVSKMLRLRAEKAKMLGYKDFAAYALAEETAKTPAAVNRILREVAPAALGKARGEAREIQRQIEKDAKAAHRKPFKLEPWDWAYYAAQVQKAKFHFDEAEVKPYFELDNVLKDGVFYAAHELYGITFKERHDLPVYQPDVRVFEVHDADGSTLGLLLLDYFKRDNKNGGAWMDTFVDQSGLLDEKPVVINNLNIPKPAPGQPALLTFDEVTTMFHEFGHGLHGLFSHCKYPLLSGTNVPPDFVEFPSQFNEMWAREPVVLAHFAKNNKTGEPMPKALLDKVLAAENFGEGYETLEYLEAAMLDQAWHQIPEAKVPPPSKVMAFERAALSKDGVAYAPVPPRYHTPYFSHIFTEGYEAGYYAYLWSEVLARDAGSWFHARGGLSRQAGQVFRDKILSRGRTEEPDALFRNFYHHPPDIKPLLEYRGLMLGHR